MGIARKRGDLAPSSIGSRVGQVQCASATGSSVTGSPYIIAIRRLTSSVVKVALATVNQMQVLLSPCVGGMSLVVILLAVKRVP